MDIVDEGNQRAAEIQSDSEKAIRALVPEAKHELTEEDLLCTQCGDEIDPRRAAIGHDICINCSRANERRDKQYNRRPSRIYDSED